MNCEMFLKSIFSSNICKCWLFINLTSKEARGIQFRISDERTATDDDILYFLQDIFSYEGKSRQVYERNA